MQVHVAVTDVTEIQDENKEAVDLTQDMVGKYVKVYFTGSILETAPLTITDVVRVVIEE